MAKKSALSVGRYIAKKFRNYDTLEVKADTSLVTEVDRTSQEKLFGALKRHFCEDTYIGEESHSQTKGSTEYVWHIDPLDGTTNFAHGFPHFCISIGLYSNRLKRPVLGIVYDPIHKRLFSAQDKQGAFLNDRPIRVSKTQTLKDALLCTGFSPNAPLIQKYELTLFQEMMANAHAMRRTGSAALDLSYVAWGALDGFFERNLNTWDICAGICLIKEAGGQITNYAGQPITLNSTSIFASNKKIHKEGLQSLSRSQ